jgi:multiple sugar transport system substrate-binding protein
MLKKGKIFSGLMAFSLIMAIVLSGCGSNTKKEVTNVNVEKSSPEKQVDKKTTLTFWTVTATPERNTLFENMVKQFEEQNPDIKVDYLGVPGDPTAFNQKVETALAAGEAPDIVNAAKSDWISRGVLEPLDDYLNKWKDKASISPAAIQANRILDAKESKLYVLPDGAQPWVLWIRPDWLKAANLTIPQTWDQFFDDAQKLTDKSKGIYGYSIRGGAGSANTLEMLMYSYSGITDYFTKDGKSTINDPANVAFVDKYLGGYNVNTPEDDVNKSWTELAATFQSGKTAMVAHNLGSASSHEKAFGGDRSKFMAIPFPKSIKGTEVHPGLLPAGISMMKNSKNKEAAWKFITFYTSKDQNSAWGKLYGEIPANLEAAKDSWIKELPYIKTGADLLTSPDTKFTSTPYNLPGYSNIQKKIEPMIQKVMFKKMTSKEMLDEWAALLEKEKADFDSANKK